MIVVLLQQSDEGDTTMAEGKSMTAREAASNVMTSSTPTSCASRWR